ncbi:MAG: SdpI family protein [Anaerolineales bacterium]|nr:SdpI family protein [Anaerolineales bacterium]MCS7248679.1 SdpI family protein [Anaerolineales bacterium]MDW8162492.1 SdpI family protein [Anaerolineales bacterium]MDW8445917.1 SdpI family protein [Anaerolineales bacterium]
MSTRTAFLVVFTLILMAIFSGILLWDRLPPLMASDWNAADEVDGYTTRFWGVFLMPIISLGMAALFWVIPLIDPLRENIARFRGIFNAFIVLVIAFLLYLHFLTLIYNLGIHFRMSRLLLPGIGVLIYFAGELLSKAKRNWFIGIRTPWTLSDDRVWAATHRLGSVLFKAAAVVAVVSAFFGALGIWVMLGSVFLAAFVPVVYSYLLFERYRKEAPYEEEGKG